jgi:hypothetical protein
LELPQFKILYKRFSSGKDGRRTKEFSDYIDAMNEDEVIRDWYLRQQIKKSKVKVGRHCCTRMTYYLTFDKPVRTINPDAIIRFRKKTKAYGIPVHDGGSSFIKIEHCPWCGTGLKK